MPRICTGAASECRTGQGANRRHSAFPFGGTQSITSPAGSGMDRKMRNTFTEMTTILKPPFDRLSRQIDAGGRMDFLSLFLYYYYYLAPTDATFHFLRSIGIGLVWGSPEAFDLPFTCRFGDRVRICESRPGGSTLPGYSRTCNASLAITQRATYIRARTTVVVLH